MYFDLDVNLIILKLRQPEYHRYRTLNGDCQNKPLANLKSSKTKQKVLKILPLSCFNLIA